MTPDRQKPPHVNLMLKDNTLTPKLETFQSGATRSPSRLRYDLIPPTALRALAERFWIGAEIHGDTNWMKGIPFSAMIYHLQEHVERFKAGDVSVRTIVPVDGSDVFQYTESDVANLAAIMWGAAGLLHFLMVGRVDLDDRKYTPGRKEHP